MSAAATSAVQGIAQRGWRRPMPGPFVAAARQMLLLVAVFAVPGALAMVGGASVAKLLFVVGGLAVAVRYWRRSPWLYLTAIFWFWTLTPFMRRVIDFRGGFDPTNIVLATPAIMTSLILLDVVRSRTLFRRPEGRLGLLVLLPIIYGLCINFVQGDIFPGAVGAMDWLMPALYYFYIIDNSERIDTAEPIFRAFLALNAVVVVGYGVVQVWSPPPWDAAWALASGMASQHEFQTEGAFRVFGTMNETGVFAFWLATLIVLSLHFYNRLSFLLVPAAGVLLLLTSDRSVAVGVVVCLIVAAMIGGARMRNGLVLMFIAVIAIGISVGNLNASIADRLTSRFGSLGELQNDDSALHRAAIWQNTPAMIADHPIGLGLGALGRGAVVSSDTDLVSVDFGPLAVYLSLGWVAGSLYLAGLAAIVLQSLFRAQRSGRPAALAFALAALGMFLQLFIVNVVGFQAAVMWLCAGCATAIATRARIAVPGEVPAISAPRRFLP